GSPACSQKNDPAHQQENAPAKILHCLDPNQISESFTKVIWIALNLVHESTRNVWRLLPTLFPGLNGCRAYPKKMRKHGLAYTKQLPRCFNSLRRIGYKL